MEQNTPEWLEWRADKIGASDIPQILNASPYGDALDLWLIKTKRKDHPGIPEFCEQAGRITEEVVRAKYSIETGKVFEPRLAQHDDFPFIIASLDGYCETEPEALEVKFVGKEKYEKGIIPPEHIWQVQQQMLVTGLPSITYLHSMDRGETYKKYVIKANKAKQLRILKACVNFYWLWRTDKAPKPKRVRRKPIILKDGTEFKI